MSAVRDERAGNALEAPGKSRAKVKELKQRLATALERTRNLADLDATLEEELAQMKVSADEWHEQACDYADERDEARDELALTKQELGGEIKRLRGENQGLQGRNAEILRRCDPANNEIARLESRLWSLCGELLRSPLVDHEQIVLRIQREMADAAAKAAP